MAEQIALALIDGKISQVPIGDTIRGAGSLSLGDKYSYFISAIAAYDRIATINWTDIGQPSQRISSVVYESTLYPDSEITKTVFYLDSGTINQRIDKIEYSGTVFSPDSLRKVFSYTLSGVDYTRTGHYYELF